MHQSSPALAVIIIITIIDYTFQHRCLWPKSCLARLACAARHGKGVYVQLLKARQDNVIPDF